MKIVILDDYQAIIRKLDCFKILQGQDVSILHQTEKNTQNLAEKILDANILVLIRERTTINKDLLSKLPNLRLICQTGKVSNHLDLAACTYHKVAVAEGVGSPIAPAELTWILIMNAIRQIPQAIEAMKEGKWQTNLGSTVYRKIIGIWGYGKIGQKIAYYSQAFGAKVLVWGSQNSREKARSDGFAAAESKEEFFAQSDVITIHLRLNKKTFGIVKKTDLGLMKEGSIFVNTARAELVAKNALLQSLKTGRPSFAALDVYECEPIFDENYELLQMPNVICTPHLGYVEKNSYEMYFSQAFENAVNFIKGKPTNIVNPEVLGD